jgi:hypothetical protein
MTFIWIAIGIAVTGVLIASVWSRFRARNEPSLGVVSHGWLNEQKNGRGDSQR